MNTSISSPPSLSPSLSTIHLSLSRTLRRGERERMAAAAAKDTEAVATRLLEARAYLHDFEQRHDPTDMEQQQVLREMRDHVGALERLAGEWVREVMTAMYM